MLLSRLRVRPWRDLCSLLSSGLVTVNTPSSCVIFMSSLKARASSPFGPLTVTRFPSIFTSTPDGIGIGCLPIRDTAVAPFLSCPLPDVGDYFAADAGLLGLLLGHDTGGGRDHGDA